MNKTLVTTKKVLTTTWAILRNQNLADVYLYGGVVVMILSLIFTHGWLKSFFFWTSLVSIINGALLHHARPQQEQPKKKTKQKIIDVEVKK